MFRCNVSCPYGKLPCEFTQQDYNRLQCLRSKIDKNFISIDDRNEFILFLVGELLSPPSIEKETFYARFDQLLKRQVEEGREISIVTIAPPFKKNYALTSLFKEYADMHGYRFYENTESPAQTDEDNLSYRMEEVMSWLKTKPHKGCIAYVDKAVGLDEGEAIKLFGEIFGVVTKLNLI